MYSVPRPFAAEKIDAQHVKRYYEVTILKLLSLSVTLAVSQLSTRSKLMFSYSLFYPLDGAIIRTDFAILFFLISVEDMFISNHEGKHFLELLNHLLSS